MKPAIRIVLAALVPLAAQAWMHLSWGIVVSALVASAVLTLAAARSRAAGAELVALLAGLYFVPSALINIPEGVLFDVIRASEAPQALLKILVQSVALAVVVAALAGRLGGRSGVEPGGARALSAGGLLARAAAAAAAFVVLYFAAGLIIYPFVKSYYEGRQMPPPGAMASMGVLRALALLGVAWPVLRSMPARRDGILILSVAFPALGALVPLLPANELMPASIRVVHALETIPYYALYGFLLALWFGKPRSEKPVDAGTFR